MKQNSYRYIRENLIPRLIEHIDNTNNINNNDLYLKNKLYIQFTHQIEEQKQQKIHALITRKIYY